MHHTDPFSGQTTRLTGAALPDSEGWASILDSHRRRLRALDQLGKSATECGIRTDKERDLLLIQEDDLGLLANEGGAWAAFNEAIQAVRRELPIIQLEAFGFSSETKDPFEVASAKLRRIGGGVEALAFIDGNQSVYKFFVLREGQVGATFSFSRGENDILNAVAVPGSYFKLFEKLRLIHEFGIPTEVIGITSDGIVLVKQTLGRMLPETEDVSGLDPDRLIPVPSRFLRADRDHPRLAFLDGEAWLVADTHNRNVVLDAQGRKRIIDLVAAPLPLEWLAQMPLFQAWIERARLDPRAEVLAKVEDSEL